MRQITDCGIGLPTRPASPHVPKAELNKVHYEVHVAALEDKIVQAAVVAILTPIYEAEFMGFSYVFRPGRSQHDALDALAYGINARKINWILDADISRFFDTLSREWLIRFVEHRIGDRRIIRLIQKWLKAGVLEDGRLIETTEGTPQGSVASPLLANVYLHYVYDLWDLRMRIAPVPAIQCERRCPRGKADITRCSWHASNVPTHKVAALQPAARGQEPRGG